MSLPRCVICGRLAIDVPLNANNACVVRCWTTIGR